MWLDDRYIEGGDLQIDILRGMLAGWDDDRIALYIAKKYGLDPQYVRDCLEEIMIASVLDLDLGGW